MLDQGYKWDLTDEEAHELGRRSIYAAGHRDAFSGNTVNLYHVQQDGWKFIGQYFAAGLQVEEADRMCRQQATTTFRSCTTTAPATTFLALPGVVMDTTSVLRAVVRLTHLRRIWSHLVVYSISCCNISLDFASFTAPKPRPSRRRPGGR